MSEGLADGFKRMVASNLDPKLDHTTPIGPYTEAEWHALAELLGPGALVVMAEHKARIAKERAA